MKKCNVELGGKCLYCPEYGLLCINFEYIKMSVDMYNEANGTEYKLVAPNAMDLDKWRATLVAAEVKYTDVINNK